MKRFITSNRERESLLEYISALTLGEWGFHCEIKLGPRTLKQNSALWLYFRMLADEMNGAGLEIHQEFLGKTIELPWTDKRVHDKIWIPIQESQFGTKSTTKLLRGQVGAIYEILSRWIAGSHGISVPFPERNYDDRGY